MDERCKAVILLIEIGGAVYTRDFNPMVSNLINCHSVFQIGGAVYTRCAVNTRDSTVHRNMNEQIRR